jgi:hypothetical protein
MNSIRNICCIFVILACSKLAAQSLQGLPENPVLKKYRLQHPNSLKSATAESLLTLPFYEDFSNVGIVPDPDKWADSYAFINTSFAQDPVSIGVATLDAIDENGEVYALTSWPASSDMLTSRPFDLSPYSQPGDTVVLSFFYQSGGKGEVPEIRDSLLLEFYNPVNDSWQKNWFAILDTATQFQQVIRRIPGLYYRSGFRFRFRNYTSVSPDEVAGGKGAVGNADCWNIDYLMMDTRPASAHATINDIAIMEPPRNLLDFYETIPWLHLNDAQAITRNYLQYVIRNLQKTFISNLGRSYYTKNLRNGNAENGPVYVDDFEPEEIIRRNDPFITPFTRNDDSNSGIIEVAGFLDTPEGQPKENDTAKIILNFRDYYAYDDGTPEYGFGISGPSMAGALLAYRFRIYTPDTLRALDIFFNKARDLYNANAGFQLCVWKDENGMPGELVYLSPEVYNPRLDSEMPGFERYAIDPDTNLVMTDTAIYVGWKQMTDIFINLGYDVNRDNVSRTFVNTSGEWYNPGNSLIPGSLMIRPVFGSKAVLTGSTEIPEKPVDLVLYPNPTSAKLFIKTSGIIIKRISLYDLNGRLLLHQLDNLEQIDVSGLQPGLYQLILDTDQGRSVTRKIVVVH